MQPTSSRKGARSSLGMWRRTLVAGIGMLVLACGGNTSDGSTGPTLPFTSPRTTLAPTTDASPTTGASPVSVRPSIPAACVPLPHAAPDLEALLPERIAGRELAKESYDGTLLVTCINGGSASDVADLAATLAAEGLTLEDLSVAVAGRSDVENDPPYFVNAYRLTGQAGRDWPAATGVDHPQLAVFTPARIAGKDVLVGTESAFDQDGHARGIPYVWNSLTIHYLVITDDPAWAEEALRALR